MAQLDIVDAELVEASTALSKRNHEMRTYYNPDTQTFFEKEYISHIETDCQECAQVPDATTILLYYCSKELKEKANWSIMDRINVFFGTLKAEDKIIELGRFTMPGWSGHSMFYLFHCHNCCSLGVNYTHGHDIRLECNSCDARMYLRSARFYINEGLEVPLSMWKQFKMLLNLKRDLAKNKRSKLYLVKDFRVEPPDEIKRFDESQTPKS